MDDDVTDLYAALFQGNQSRYGTEGGGSVVIDADWDDIAELHLAGEIEPIGVYPIDPETGLCRWGCVDFDEGETESLIHARNVQIFLECEGITSWMERSRSKGFHVWVFAREWMPPQVMRTALLYACEFVDAPTKEINPKQVSLQGDQVGNYVRLPYPRPLFFGRRQMLWPDGMCWSLTDFVHEAFKNRVWPAQLQRIASHRHKPSTPIEQKTYTPVQRVEADSDSEGDLLPLLPRRARRLFENGSQFPDRSAGLCYLAGQIVRENPSISEGECKRLLACADAKWGKYSGRSDADVRLEDIVRRAFADRDRFY